MKQLTIYQDNYSDSTVISNRFIDEYMKDANDAQLKVYLYLIRAMSAHRSTSVSEMADVFNHTEKDVMRALKYWEKQKLLSLDYDTAKNLTGIHLKELRSTAPEIEDMVPVSPTVIKTAVTLSSPKNTTQQQTGRETATEGTCRQPAGDALEKPSYSLDDVKAFQNREDTEQLLFIIEAYIGKPLSPSDIRTILFICDKLNFSVDLVDYLVQYCVGRGKKDFRYIEKVAVNWAEDHITTPKQAAALIKKYDKNVYGIMNALGKSGAPTDKEMEFIDRWNKQFCFPSEVIKEACDRTVLATDKHRFEYADSILTSWSRSGVKQLADIQTADENYAKSRTSQKAVRASSNKFNQFKQNTYDFSSLENEILSN
ncbi:MAG: DnaD domain protein [Clostridiales bacterium]|nr:DnaD domain protein [Clostridiales bacterium]